jgi:SanA protein
MCVFGVSGLLAVYIVIQTTSAWRVASFESVDPRPVALVLGSSVKSRKPNTILQERLDTAIRLYGAGKVKKMILSGDNRTIDYNEPQAMKTYLLGRGIPEGDLILDHAGRRTYDSCYRARDVFHLSSIMIVTQNFHLPRALYLCNALGLDAVGVASDEEYPERWWFSYLREVPATIGAWIDITIKKPTPLLGKPEKVFE